MCTRDYPYDANNIEDLEVKILDNKPLVVPNYVSNDLCKIIKQCLMKKSEARPEIRKIIESEVFQIKCREHRITLPLELNKEKLR